MRFFVALDIPKYIQEQIEVAQDKLQELIPEVRLTPPQKLHITIAFVGDQPEKILSEIKSILADAAEGVKPFSLTPAYVDAFPNIHYPRIIWLGLKGDTDKLFVLQERIKDGIEELGLGPDQRRYVPHIAIAKMSNNYEVSQETEKELQKFIDIKFDAIYVDKIKLFQSIPEEGFHVHNTLAEIHL